MSTQTTIGKIYSTNCIHCIEIAPKWENMKKSIQEGGHAIKIVEFEIYKDAEKFRKYNEKLKKDHGVEITYDGVPTLFRLNGGKIDYYNGERESHLMVKWALGKKNGGNKKRTLKQKKITLKQKKRTLKQKKRTLKQNIKG